MGTAAGKDARNDGWVWGSHWPVDFNKESGSMQALDHYVGRGERAQGNLTGCVFPESNNAPGNRFTPDVRGGETARERERREMIDGPEDIHRG